MTIAFPTGSFDCAAAQRAQDEGVFDTHQCIGQNTFIL